MAFMLLGDDTEIRRQTSVFNLWAAFQERRLHYSTCGSHQGVPNVDFLLLSTNSYEHDSRVLLHRCLFLSVCIFIQP